MTALDSAALERRYRRLLAWFPAEHRRVYGEEMIGVLLSSASDGQNRPGPGEAANLVSAGLITRLRTWSGNDKIDWTWADALAAYRVTAPVLMLALISSSLGFALRYKPTRWVYGLTPGVGILRPTVLLMMATTVAALAVAIACPVLRRRGHPVAAALLTTMSVLLGAIATVRLDVVVPGSRIPISFTAFFVVNLAAVALVPDSGRGWRALTARGAYRRLLALLAIFGCPLIVPLQPAMAFVSTLAIAALVGLAIWRASRKRRAPGPPQAGVAG